MKSVKFLVLLVILIFSLSATAQRDGSGDQNWEKIESARIAYISSKLDLSSAEAKAFWPVYNAYQKERRALHRKDDIEGEIASLSEAESTHYLNLMLEAEREELKLMETYFSDLRKIISDTKILLLQEAERNFKRELVRSMREARDQEKSE
jgi:hypothetical protein